MQFNADYMKVKVVKTLPKRLEYLKLNDHSNILVTSKFWLGEEEEGVKYS